ncbi:MAG: hypothetical protein GY758_00975 [Fuerstiella sp.]|nr:hypothetical protein [Fuerstiella sp.]
MNIMEWFDQHAPKLLAIVAVWATAMALILTFIVLTMWPADADARSRSIAKRFERIVLQCPALAGVAYANVEVADTLLPFYLQYGLCDLGPAPEL